MPKKDLELSLQQMGFSKSEAKVYLFLLRKGTASVSEIVKGAGVPKSTVHKALDRFLETNLISYFEAKPKRKYVVESPEQLKKYLEQTIKKQHAAVDDNYRKQKKTLNNNLAEFIREESVERPKVRFYENAEGVLEIRKDIQECEPKTVYNIFDWDKIQTTIKKDKKFIRHTKKNERWPRKNSIIYTSKNDHVKKKGKNPNSKFYFTNKKLPAEITVYKNKIAMIDNRPNNTVALLIENKNLATTIKSIFELAKHYIEK